MVAAARAAQPGWEELGFEGRRRGPAGRPPLDGRQRRARRRRRSAARPAGPPTRRSSPSSPTGSRRSSSGPRGRPRTSPTRRSSRPRRSSRGRRIVVRYAPLGVVGVIGPWNYPLNNSFGDCIPALAAGNAVVMKPSEVTPLTSLLMAEMLAECGIPESVFPVATGRGETGAALIDEVDFVMFTGSVATGKKVMAQAAQTLTPVSLELGGKDPMIVLADADLERAANAAVSYGLNNSGQVCISVERIYVEEPIHDEFVDRLTEKVRGAAPGPARRAGVGRRRRDHLPAADRAHRGARPRRGRQGRHAWSPAASPPPGPGRFYQPTVLTGVDHSMRCMTEETFGPTLPVMRVADAEQAIELANEGPYGLQASVWTRDDVRGEEIARRVEAGVALRQRRAGQLRGAGAADGRLEESGLGSRHGADGIRKYTAASRSWSRPATRRRATPTTSPTAPRRARRSARRSRALRHQRPLLDDAQRATLIALCDTFIPSLDAARRRRPTRTASGPAPPRTRRSRGGRDRAAAGRAAGRADRRAARRCSTRSPRSGMAAAAPQRAARGDRLGFCDQSPEALAGITTLRGHRRSLFYALPDPGTGLQPELGRDRLSRARSAPPADRERPLESDRPERRRGADRGRRLRRRLGRRRRGDRRRARRRRQVGLRARDGRLPRRLRLRRARALGLPAPLT